MKQQPFIVRYLSHPVMAAWTIAFLSLIAAVVALYFSGHEQVAFFVSPIGTFIISGGFGCYALWHWATHQSR